MQKNAINRAKASDGSFNFHKKGIFTLLLACLAIGDIYSQCNCFEGYEIGDINNPNGVTNLSQTDLYADFPSGLTGNGFDLGCVNIYGRLVIDENYFFDNCFLMMGEGAEIEIRNDDLEIRNQTLLLGCLTMWRGITLTGNSPGLEMENSTIKDAQYAVMPNSVSSTAKLRLTNNVFDANYVGLHVPASNFLITKIGGNSYISGNQFVFNSFYMPPYAGQSPSPGSYPFAAFELIERTGFTVGNPNNGNVVNYIENIEHGVVHRGLGGNTYYTGLQISHPNNYYDNSVGILIENTPLSIEAKYNNMNQAAYGIKSIASRDKKLERNTIEANKACIHIYKETRGNVLIKDNTLNASENGKGVEILECHLKDNYDYDILSNDITVNAGIGILVQQSSGSIFIEDENNIDFDFVQYTPPYVGTSPQNYGIVLFRTLGPTTVKNNHIDNDLSQFFATGGIWVGNCENTHVVDNDIKGINWSGLYMEFSSSTLFCCNETPSTMGGGILIRGYCAGTKLSNTELIGGVGPYPQGLILISAEIGQQTNHGNDWRMTNTFWDARFYGPSDPANSIFITNQTLIPNGYSKIVATPFPPSYWFKFLGIDPTCASQVNCDVEPYMLVGNPNGSDHLTDHDLNVLEPVADPNEPILQVLKWESQRRLYQKLVHNPSLITWNNDVTTFYNNAQTGLVGQFHDVEAGIRGLSSPPEPHISDVENIRADLTVLVNDIAVLEVQLETADPQQEAALLAQIDAMFQQVNTLQTDLDNVEAQIASWRAGEIATLMVANDALVPTSNFQQYEKEMNGVNLATVLQGNTTFTAPQQALVDSIADFCPSTNGTGVYLARALKQYDVPGWTWALDECMPVESHSAESVQDEPGLPISGVQFFPNPAKSSFTVQFEHPLETEATLSIFDVTGKLRTDRRVAKGTSKTTVNIASLRPGIYVVEIKTEGETLSTSRITVVD